MSVAQEFPRLYVILDAALAGERLARVAEECAEAGVELVQYRAKGASALEIFTACRMLGSVFAGRGVRLIVNDRPDVAALAGAGGTHSGQDDLRPIDARWLCPAPQWVGISTHTVEQVREADAAPVDYVAVGPIYATRTKERLEAVVGTEFVRRAREQTRKPLVAIGGITLERAEEVFRAGADAVAVGREVVKAAKPGERAREILDLAWRMRSEGQGA